MNSLRLAFAAAALAATATAAHAATNLGFESGNLAGWTTNGQAGAAAAYGSFAPAQGGDLGYAQAGLGVGVYTTLSQSFTLSAGSTISGLWGFQSNDYAPYDDKGYLAIGGVTLLASSVDALPSYGSTGWLAWSYTAPTTGTYILSAGVANGLDNNCASGVVLDGVQVTSVPEPASFALLALGLAGLAAMRPRRRLAR